MKKFIEFMSSVYLIDMEEPFLPGENLSKRTESIYGTFFTDVVVNGSIYTFFDGFVADTRLRDRYRYDFSVDFGISVYKYSEEAVNAYIESLSIEKSASTATSSAKRRSL